MQTQTPQADQACCQPGSSAHIASSQSKLPITILTGFLGSGKTTLLNHILTEHHGHRIAVIENEFGEVDVDSDLVLTSEEEIFQMKNGCICCFVDVRNDLIEVMHKLLARRDQFDHILVETSGLADPTPVATAFFVNKDIAAQVELDAIVTLVDAKHIDQHLYDPVLDGSDNQAVNQVVAADRIVVNKTDLANDAALDGLESSLRKLNQTAPILRSQYGTVPLSEILNVKGFRPSYLRERAELLNIDLDDEHDDDDHDDHHHEHDETVQSHSFVYPEPFDEHRLGAFLNDYLNEHGDDIFRAKGIISVKDDNRFFVLQAVHKLVDFRADHDWEGDVRKSKFVFIGRNLKRDEIDGHLRACLASAPH